MHPKVKKIEITRREFDPDEYKTLITFARWSQRKVKGVWKTNQDTNQYQTFWNPTPASLARCRRAQDGMK